MTARKIVAPEIIIEAYRRNRGNLRATARELGVDKDTARNSLRLYGAYDKPLVGGTTKPLKHNVLPLPEKGKVARYILSSAQNNTGVFEAFLKNLEAYAAWFEEPARIMVARFSYNKAAFNNKSAAKPGSDIEVGEETWFDPRIEPYICDDPEEHGTCRWQLAPDFVFCGEMQISPTAVRPLSGLSTYTSKASCAFPHVKVALDSVPSMPDEPTKLMYTTGSVTGRNYIKRKAGLKAEFHHVNGALIVEVNSDGDWWARQLLADSSGAFYDCPNGYVVKVAAGEVAEGHRLEALNWGDTHLHDLPQDRITRYWIGESESQPAVVDTLRPRYEIHNDILSFRSRNHHEMKSFSKMLQKHVDGIDLVEAELKQLADFLCLIAREDCTTIICRANHDEACEKWLDEASYKADLVNVETFLEAQLARVRAIKSGDKDWMFIEWASRKHNCPEKVRFLKRDESFVICKNTHPIECGLHGDMGPNGARGTTNNLAVMGAKLNKGHSHVAVIMDGVYSAGTLSLSQSYNHGPSAWSVSSIATYPSGKRTMLTERAGKLWA